MGADPCVARAFLALSDDPGFAPRPRLRRAVCAAVAAFVLAVAAPLAWDQSAATTPSKSAVVADDAEDEA
jgi:hypothetical protein